ncbi:MAG: hypothetical protein ACTSQ4_10640 [Candidatus Heimdallarchaeaceae archaeon]
MFDRLELSTSLSKYLVSISPILGISGDIENKEFFMITKYFSLKDDKILIEICKNSAPEEFSLNLLRKGEDSILMAAQSGIPINEKYFQNGTIISAPIYLNSVISFECKLDNQLLVDNGCSIAIYKIVQASGVAGLDPDFNDDVTIAKTIEIMTLAAVDTHIVNKKIAK